MEKNMPQESVDEVDVTLLRFLQENGRASNVQIADHLNLSETPSWRRLKRLETEKIIEGYHATLNREKLGFDILAFVQIMFSVHTDDTPSRFEDAVQEIPEILSCFNVTGDADYMLVIVAENLKSYEALLRKKIRCLPGVRSLKTIISMREVKHSQNLPLYPIISP